MKLLKDWTLIEKILLFGSVITILTVGIVFHSEWLTVTCSVLGVITALLHAKGKIISQFFGIVITIIYSIVSFKNQYYGEMISYIGLMLPLNIVGIISWVRHKNEKTDSVQINKIKIKEWIIVGIVSLFVFAGLYFVLKAFNTNELIVSTFTSAVCLLAVYCQTRRSRASFIFWIAYDVFAIILWGIPVIKGDLLLLPMFINPMINFLNDVYGTYNWKKTEKIQKVDVGA